MAVYLPAGYVPNTPAPFIVVQDGQQYVPGDPPAAADGQPRPFMPVMLDNLIHAKRVPAIVAVMVHHGGGDGQVAGHWRGWIQHVRNGSQVYFASLRDLTSFIEQETGIEHVHDQKAQGLV